MKRVNQYVFYQLGSIVHPILTVEEGQSLPQSVWELNKARAWVEFVLDNQLFRIVVCQKTAQKLVEAIDAVVPRKTSEFSAN